MKVAATVLSSLLGLKPVATHRITFDRIHVPAYLRLPVRGLSYLDHAPGIQSSPLAFSDYVNFKSMRNK